MQRLLLSTALAGLIGTAALAQTTPPATTAPATPTAPAAPGMPMAGDTFIGERVTDAIYASQFIGKPVYVAEQDVTETTLTDASTDWDNIGEVNDILISREGQVDGILVDVGGFLGIGERTVAVDMSALRLVTDSDTAGDYFIVFRSNREALEAAPEYDFPETLAQQSVAPAGTGTMTTTGTATGTDTTGTGVGQAARDMAAATGAAVGGAAATMRGWMNPSEGYARIEATGLTSEQLKGVNVYDSHDAKVGEIAEVKMTGQGQAEQVVVDVGGFLGIGAKPVALSLSEMEIHKQTDGDGLRAYVNMTKEQLEALPAHSDS